MPNILADFEQLPTWGKIAVALAGAGVVIFAVITIRNKSNASAQPNVTPLGNLTSTNGATSVQQLLQGLGYDPTTGAALSTGQQQTTPATATGQVATSGGTDPYATQKAVAIQQWQQKTGKKWTGPAGSYPAGWIKPDVPGALTNDPHGNLVWIVPLSGSGSNSTGGGPIGPIARAPLASAFAPAPVPSATSRYQSMRNGLQGAA